MASKRAGLVLAVGIWGVAAAGGLYAVTAHGAAPGRAAEAPGTLAASFRSSGRATLVIAAHPACPCTRATFHELDRILASARSAGGTLPDVVILFAGNPQRDRVASDLREHAERMKGVRIVDDPKLEIAKSLGARTSGTVLFYNAEGALKFSGGITGSRGHEGDNRGADAVRALLEKTPAATTNQTPVYGCSLSTTTTP